MTRARASSRPTTVKPACSRVRSPPSASAGAASSAIRASSPRARPNWLIASAAPHRRASARTWHGRPGYLRRCHGPGWALVGDAGYFKDPHQRPRPDATRSATPSCSPGPSSTGSTRARVGARRGTRPTTRRRATGSASPCSTSSTASPATSGTTPRSPSCCCSSAPPLADEVEALAALETGGRRDVRPDPARRLGPSRRRGLPVGRAHGRVPSPRRPRRRRDRDARRARHERSGDLAAGAPRGAAHIGAAQQPRRPRGRRAPPAGLRGRHAAHSTTAPMSSPGTSPPSTRTSS